MSEIKNITLYHYPLSRSARVKWLLHEMHGEDFETVRVALRKGEQFSDAFRAKNPSRGVPVLEVTYADGTEQTITESMAILTWLGDTDPNFAPPVNDLRARAEYLQVMALGGSWMDQMLWNIRLHETLLPKPARSEAFAKLNRDRIETEIAPQLTKRLESHDYICGESFTAADCLTGQNLNWASAYGLCINDTFKAYMKRMKQRPAFQLAFADAAEFEG